jgi:uncharacterized protein
MVTLLNPKFPMDLKGLGECRAHLSETVLRLLDENGAAPEAQAFSVAVSRELCVSAVAVQPDARASGIAVIVAHGAGNDMHHPLLVDFCNGLARAGCLAVRFNFPYAEQGRKAPDRQETLALTWRRVSEHVRDAWGGAIGWTVAAGKSMGGRVASQLAADGGLPCDGLVFLGYPLHPAGDRSRLRDGHLARIGAPMLFFAGTRDALCDMDVLASVLVKLGGRAELEVIPGGDHSFRVPKASPLTTAEVHARIVAQTLQWLQAHVSV